jgi:hypothetical protein
VLPACEIRDADAKGKTRTQMFASIRSKRRTIRMAGLFLDFPLRRRRGGAGTHGHCLPVRQTLPSAPPAEKPLYSWKNGPNKMAQGLRQAGRNILIRKNP